MAYFDLPLDALRTYRPERAEPEDFDTFWKSTLTEAAGHDLAAEFVPYDAGLTEVDVFDVSFAGWGGHRISGWFLTPRHAAAHGPVPCAVVYVGYHRGRGVPHDHLLWPASGRAVFVMDTRGQGASEGDHPGATPDPYGTGNPQTGGMLTRGILDPAHYYYRRVYTDGVRAVDAAKSHPAVDPSRVHVVGRSQGAGIATAVAGLRDDVFAGLIDVPFLTHFRRALEITNADPYQEIVRFLKTQRGTDDAVFRTLTYFDGRNFAARADCPALYSVGLMDPVSPPSTVFASYNAWAHPDKDIDVYPWNGHEGGISVQPQAQLRWLGAR
ncbi:MAG TPA: acetylxylan esterase [Actinospica sp.]|jgi:cephalosporin-C deacetylase|nr:acetylxylan esterase [Actinospica sp.]